MEHSGCSLSTCKRVPLSAAKMEELKELAQKHEVYEELMETYVRQSARKAIKDKMTNIFKTLIDNKRYDLIPANPTILKVLEEYSEITDNITDLKFGKCNWCFFTINYKDDYSHEEVYETTKTFLEKCKFTKTHLWSIEQRSEDHKQKDFYGFHVHILFHKDNNPPSKIYRAFKTKFFDKFVGNEKSINTKYVENPEGTIKYILGNKKDDEKDAKIQQDEIFRELYGYKRYYLQGDQLQELVEKIKESD